MTFGVEGWRAWTIPELSCSEVKATLKVSFEDALQQVEELHNDLRRDLMESWVKATETQVLFRTWPWWSFLGPLLPQISTAFNVQAALCARSGCCQDWALGEAMLSWRRVQERMNLLLWLGTFQGSLALAPDTVEGRYLEGEGIGWNEELNFEMSTSERVVHQNWLEFRSAERLFELCHETLRKALSGLGQRMKGGTAYASSVVALYELMDIRTIDEGLLRWLSQGIFRGKSVGEFGALNGASSRWLNESKLLTSRAFDGARGVTNLTRGRVTEQDLSVPLLAESYDWILCLEVAEHIPQARLGTFLENLRRHAKEGAVVSWSWCGAGGEHHISCRSPEEARALFAKVGLIADLEASAAAQAASSVWWISRTVQVYRATRRDADTR
ncbi:unnamed protein product [Durusdinium trenchii]|uniref:Uncharacterized protein n=2 Tax=Durusdinium trenchii TaxID=1381693 RepID=A0ABP0RY93_9DINO